MYIYIYISLYSIIYYKISQLVFHNILQDISKYHNCNKVPLNTKKRLWSNSLMEANVLAVDHPKLRIMGDRGYGGVLYKVGDPQT